MSCHATPETLEYDLPVEYNVLEWPELIGTDGTKAIEIIQKQTGIYQRIDTNA